MVPTDFQDPTSAVSIDAPRRFNDEPSVRKVLSVQWGGNGESRITPADRNDIADAVDAHDDSYRLLFPLHGAWGALSLGVDGTTLWLYTDGGAYIVGELVDPALARPRSVPASGTVDITALPPEQQQAIMTLLNARPKRK